MTRPRLTYANVVATLALIIAVGGASAFAATQLGKNSIGPRQLKKNAVTTGKIKNEAITAAKVKKGSLTGTQINAAMLGQVPNAQFAQTAQSAQLADSLSAPEGWHYVGTPGVPQFLHKWASSKGEPVAFYKDHEGIVHLKGSALTGEPFEPIFQLPAGYRPDSTTEWVTPWGFCASGGVSLIIVYRNLSDPETAGAVVIGSVSGGTVPPVINLDDISFRAES